MPSEIPRRARGRRPPRPRRAIADDVGDLRPVRAVDRHHDQAEAQGGDVRDDELARGAALSRCGRRPATRPRPAVPALADRSAARVADHRCRRGSPVLGGAAQPAPTPAGRLRRARVDDSGGTRAEVPRPVRVMRGGTGGRQVPLGWSEWRRSRSDRAGTVPSGPTSSPSAHRRSPPRRGGRTGQHTAVLVSSGARCWCCP